MAFPLFKYEPFVPDESSSVVLPFWNMPPRPYAESMTFGSHLRTAREAKKLSQEQLGKGLGTDGADASKSVVYGWEKGQHFPRVDQLILICNKLGCSADCLLFGADAPAKLSPESAQLAAEIDGFEGEVRSHIIRLCKETIRFARDFKGEAAPEAKRNAG